MDRTSAEIAVLSSAVASHHADILNQRNYYLHSRLITTQSWIYYEQTMRLRQYTAEANEMYQTAKDMRQQLVNYRNKTLEEFENIRNPLPIASKLKIKQPVAVLNMFDQACERELKNASESLEPLYCVSKRKRKRDEEDAVQTSCQQPPAKKSKKRITGLEMLQNCKNDVSTKPVWFAFKPPSKTSKYVVDQNADLFELICDIAVDPYTKKEILQQLYSTLEQNTMLIVQHLYGDVRQYISRQDASSQIQKRNSIMKDKLRRTIKKALRDDKAKSIEAARSEFTRWTKEREFTQEEALQRIREFTHVVYGRDVTNLDMWQDSSGNISDYMFRPQRVDVDEVTNRARVNFFDKFNEAHRLTKILVRIKFKDKISALDAWKQADTNSRRVNGFSQAMGAAERAKSVTMIIDTHILPNLAACSDGEVSQTVARLMGRSFVDFISRRTKIDDKALLEALCKATTGRGDINAAMFTTVCFDQLDIFRRAGMCNIERLSTDEEKAHAVAEYLGYKLLVDCQQQGVQTFLPVKGRRFSIWCRLPGLYLDACRNFKQPVNSATFLIPEDLRTKLLQNLSAFLSKRHNLAFHRLLSVICGLSIIASSDPSAWFFVKDRQTLLYGRWITTETSTELPPDLAEFLYNARNDDDQDSEDDQFPPIVKYCEVFTQQSFDDPVNYYFNGSGGLTGGGSASRDLQAQQQAEQNRIVSRALERARNADRDLLLRQLFAVSTGGEPEEIVIIDDNDEESAETRQQRQVQLKEVLDADSARLQQLRDLIDQTSRALLTSATSGLTDFAADLSRKIRKIVAARVGTGETFNNYLTVISEQLPNIIVHPTDSDETLIDRIVSKMAETVYQKLRATETSPAFYTLSPRMREYAAIVARQQVPKGSTLGYAISSDARLLSPRKDLYNLTLTIPGGIGDGQQPSSRWVIPGAEEMEAPIGVILDQQREQQRLEAKRLMIAKQAEHRQKLATRNTILGEGMARELVTFERSSRLLRGGQTSDDDESGSDEERYQKRPRVEEQDRFDSMADHPSEFSKEFMRQYMEGDEYYAEEAAAYDDNMPEETEYAPDTDVDADQEYQEQQQREKDILAAAMEQQEQQRQQQQQEEDYDVGEDEDMIAENVETSGPTLADELAEAARVERGAEEEEQRRADEAQARQQTTRLQAEKSATFAREEEEKEEQRRRVLEAEAEEIAKTEERERVRKKIAEIIARKEEVDKSVRNQRQMSRPTRQPTQLPPILTLDGFEELANAYTDDAKAGREMNYAEMRDIISKMSDTVTDQLKEDQIQRLVQFNSETLQYQLTIPLSERRDQNLGISIIYERYRSKTHLPVANHTDLFSIVQFLLPQLDTLKVKINLMVCWCVLLPRSMQESNVDSFVREILIGNEPKRTLDSVGIAENVMCKLLHTMFGEPGLVLYNNTANTGEEVFEGSQQQAPIHLYTIASLWYNLGIKAFDDAQDEINTMVKVNGSEFLLQLMKNRIEYTSLIGGVPLQPAFTDAVQYILSTYPDVYRPPAPVLAQRRVQKLIKSTEAISNLATMRKIDSYIDSPEFVGLKTTADGDCLWNSASMFLYKTEDYAGLIKLATYLSVKVNDHNKYYWNDSKLALTMFQEDVISGLRYKADSPMFMIKALGKMLQRPIRVVSITQLDNGSKVDTFNQEADRTGDDIMILAFVNAENIFQANRKANHFYPIVRRNTMFYAAPNVKM